MPLKIFQKLCRSNNGPTAGVSTSIRLPFMQRIFYGVGHVFNDLCANCWFSYLLLYMTKVVSLSNAHAGLVLLIGQVADAIFTPFIGYGCDKTNVKHYGRRKLWHLIGSVCVLLSFPFIFNLCLNCEDASTIKLVVYYSGFVVVFQFGWASVQISHLSLIPEIARKVSEKVELNAIRSGLTFVCGIYVFGVTWLLLGTNPEGNVTRNVAPQFMLLSFIVVGTGCVFSFIFHLGTTEPRNYGKPKETKPDEAKSSSESLNHESSNQESPVEKKQFENCATNGTANGFSSAAVVEKIDDDVISDNNQLLQTPNANKVEKCKVWKEWFKSPFFYKMALIYMCTRLTLNVSQAYFVLYLTETMEFEKEAIAYFPLLVLVSGVISSVLVKVLTKRIGARLTFIIGCLAALVSFVWLFFVEKDARKSVYCAALLMGGGCSIMLVTSLAMTADLIGSHKGSCAFVYSAMSFTDKLSSGIVIYVIQQLKPSTDSGTFTKYVQTVVTGMSCIIGLICVAVFFPSDFSWKKKKPQKDVHTKTIIDEEANEVDSNQCASAEIEKDDLSSTLLDDKLKRLSWHSSMTSYMAWRLASPHVPSPMMSRRTNDSTEDAEEV